MLSTEITLPSHYDPLFIKQRAQLQHAGWDDTKREAGEDYSFVVITGDDDPEALDRALEQINGYPVSYLDEMLPRYLKRASEVRDLKIMGFSFEGLSIPLTEATQLKITGLAAGLELDPESRSVSWSLGGGEFHPMDRTKALALAKEAFRHVQHCFSAHAEIAAEIKAAQTIDDIRDLIIADHPAWAKE